MTMIPARFGRVARVDVPVMKAKFRIEHFLIGFFLGPVGLLFASGKAEKKGSISSALYGWGAGWIAAVLVGMLCVTIVTAIRRMVS